MKRVDVFWVWLWLLVCYAAIIGLVLAGLWLVFHWLLKLAVGA
jgi:hypothetical protein